MTKTTRNDQPSVAADAVRDLVAAGVNGAAEWQVYSKLHTAHTMWYGNWYRMCGEDGRLRCKFHQTKDPSLNRGTVSGRLAVERVQLQALPHDHQIPDGLPTPRSFFQPAEGHELWELDLSQAEYRTAASVARAPALIEAFERGEDAHDTTTALVFKIGPGHPGEGPGGVGEVRRSRW